ncbi:hypothetical protein AVEN_27772-1 [Araneus ventricosus]|uniref:Uncharacterized protein n=1 Tax=Araneus ventricosus TaxID=182803 RepID=A0A4Y2JF18_ARAVE|nr:hypothetical protein AVEN_27772-1 [Araneus ventricosus]
MIIIARLFIESFGLCNSFEGLFTSAAQEDPIIQNDIKNNAILNAKIYFAKGNDEMLGNPQCIEFAITKLFVDYVMHSSFPYRQLNSNFTCGDPTILPYELTHSRKRDTIGYNERLRRAWQVLDVYTSAS